MRTSSIVQRLHDKAPKLGKAVSFGAATGVIAVNSFGGGIPLWLMGTAKMLTGAKVADNTVIRIADHWIRSNNAVIDKLLPKKDWRIQLPDDVREDGQYLLICNHQSWVDTSIVQYISEDRLPLTRFFTKHELIYIPIVGQAFYFLDFPMMRRYSKEQIAKNPALKNQDLIEAERACKLLKDKPFTLLNYLEGTRFTPEKKAKQDSPYQHLLKPKAGGLALAISALGKQIDGILDMTIVYPDGTPSYTDLWKGDITRLGVDVRHIDIPKPLFDSIVAGGYQNDPETKAQMFAWVEEAWRQKDELIASMLQDFNDNPAD